MILFMLAALACFYAVVRCIQLGYRPQALIFLVCGWVFLALECYLAWA